ncbi:MAG: hypothetical protein ACRD98_11180, partial [Nitrososphaera sp.]
DPKRSVARTTEKRGAWLGIGINDFERHQLQTLREELEQQFHEQNTVALKPASRSENYTNQKT